jgi:hypothetical protein
MVVVVTGDARGRRSLERWERLVGDDDGLGNRRCSRRECQIGQDKTPQKANCEKHNLSRRHMA